MPIQTAETVKSRMKSPAQVLPEVMQALRALNRATERGSVSPRTVGLVQLRASQIKRLQRVCGHAQPRPQESRRNRRSLFAVAAWRDAPYFTGAERAALALAEAVTRLSDRSDPVPDAVWDDFRQHYDERASAALITSIALINAWNRLNVATRQVAGEWAKSAEAEKVRSADR